MKKCVPILILVLIVAQPSVGLAFDILSAIGIIERVVATSIDVLNNIERYKKESRERGRLDDTPENRHTRDGLKHTSVDLINVMSDKQRFIRDLSTYQEEQSSANWAKVKERSLDIHGKLEKFRANLMEEGTYLATPSGHLILQEFSDTLTLKEDNILMAVAREPVGALDISKFGQLVEVLKQEANQLKKINAALLEYTDLTFHP